MGHCVIFPSPLSVRDSGGNARIRRTKNANAMFVQVAPAFAIRLRSGGKSKAREPVPSNSGDAASPRLHSLLSGFGQCRQFHAASLPNFATQRLTAR
jgi:hypothetical protein